MIKKAIGILDSGFGGTFILEELAKYYKNERFIYLNDLKHYPFYNRPEGDALNIIKSHIDLLLKEDIKLLIVLSDIIVDIAFDYLQEFNIQVINIVDLLINYVNKNYENKNICLFGKTEVIEANLYQKNFKYNRLYNIPSEDLELFILQKQTKTSQSFKAVQVAFNQVRKRSIDCIVASSPYLIELNTELKEHLEFNEITNLKDIIIEDINERRYFLNPKGRGSINILSNLEKKEFSKLIKFKKLKYDYIDIEYDQRKKRAKLNKGL